MKDQDKKIETQLEGMEKLIELSKMRTDFSAGRSYMNSERTLSVWIRTALTTMVFGVAISRLDVLYIQMDVQSDKYAHIEFLTQAIGFGLVLLSIFMALTSGLRYVAYTKDYKKDYPFPAHHNAWLPATYAAMTVVFGVVLLILMFSFDKIG